LTGDTAKFIRVGEIVEVLAPSEIIETLDGDGTLDGLPFMPEMIEYCGKKFRVLSKASKTCVGIMGLDLTLQMAEFKNDDVFFLEGLRCTGIAHGGCGRSCRLFWKAAWLRKAAGQAEAGPTCQADSEKLRGRLKTRRDEKTYFCQSTRLRESTGTISRSKKIVKTCEDLLSGSCTGTDAIMATTSPVVRKLLEKLKPANPGKTILSTPEETLSLQPGEIVDVKPIREIEATLDANGKNRGLAFIPDMKRYCGKRFRVRSRIERIILEHSGEMVEVRDTVLLEKNTCTYDHTFGGCPRNEFNYWREIWLRRVHQ
jgi:hypothetical protein